MNFSGIKAVNQNLGKVVYSTKTTAILPFEHWLKDIRIDNGLKAKNQRKVATSATVLAKQAADAFGEVEEIFMGFLKKHKLDKSVEFLRRTKSTTGAANKANMETKKMYQSVGKEMSQLKDLKININDILPENKKKIPAKFNTIYDETRQLLSKKATNDMLGFEDFRKIINQQEFAQKYGEDGALFARKINARIKNSLAAKIKETFVNIEAGNAKIEKYANNIDDVSAQLRDITGIRFVIKNPSASILNKIPQEKHNEYMQKYMEKEIKKITDLFVDMHNDKKADIKKVTLYGGDESYLKKANVQKIQTLGDDVHVSKPRTLPNHYVTTQGNLIIETPKGKKSIRVEFQIRGEEINNFAEVEHIPYDLREGKPIDFSKYNKEQKILIRRIQQSAKKMSKDAELQQKYDKYVADCYDYYFAKEYGIEKENPIFPQGLDSVLSKESLFKLLKH